MTDTPDDKSTESQADELTEMWDASALDAAVAGFEAPPPEKPKPAATAPVRRDEPSVQVNVAAIAAPPPKRKPKKKKRGLAALGLPMQLALVVFVAVGTFGIVKLLLAH